MNKPAVTIAKMRRMKAALERDGLPFGGYLTKPDGSVAALVALTERGAAAASSDPLDIPSRPFSPSRTLSRGDGGLWDPSTKRRQRRPL